MRGSKKGNDSRLRLGDDSKEATTTTGFRIGAGKLGQRRPTMDYNNNNSRMSVQRHTPGNSSLGKSLRSCTTMKRSGRIEKTIPFAAKYKALYCVKFSPDGETMAAGFEAGAIEIYSADGELMHKAKAASKDAEAITYVKFHPLDDELLFAVGISGDILVYKLRSSKLQRFAKEINNEINTFDVNRSGHRIVTGGKDGALRVYDVDSGKLWDVRTKNGSVLNIPGPQVYGDAIDVRDDNVLTASWRVSESLELWDMRTGTLLDTVIPMNRIKSINGEFIFCARFFRADEEGRYVLSGTNGIETLEVISVGEKKVVEKYKTDKHIFAVDSFGTKVVFGGTDSSIKIGSFSSNSSIFD